MTRLSILGMLILVAIFALVFALFAWLREEALFYVTGPILGAMLTALTYSSDRWAWITGGAIGGLFQGICAVMFLKRGYIFPDVSMLTGPLFLATLGVHLASGLVFGTLLALAFRWARPRANVEDLAECPDTFAFKTRAGMIGLLQFEQDKKETGKLTVRYKVERGN